MKFIVISSYIVISTTWSAHYRPVFTAHRIFLLRSLLAGHMPRNKFNFQAKTSSLHREKTINYTLLQAALLLAQRDYHNATLKIIKQPSYTTSFLLIRTLSEIVLSTTTLNTVNKYFISIYGDSTTFVFVYKLCLKMESDS